MGLPAYAELHCQSCYSFLTGASHPEALVARAAELGYSALAITDECSLAGVVKAHVEAKRLKLPLLIGASFHLHGNDTLPGLQLVLLAQTRQGYGNLCELISLGRQRASKGTYRLSLDDMAQPPPELAHLRHMPDCVALLVPAYDESFPTLQQQAHWVQQTFGARAWVSLTLLLQGRDARHQAQVMAAAQAAGLPVVATGQVQMHVRSRKPLHDTLTAIRQRTSIMGCGWARAANAERHLRTRLRVANTYPPETLAETLEVAIQCPFSLSELHYEYPEASCPEGSTPAMYLREQTVRGARERYPQGVPDTVQKQIEHELGLITELRYESYFLTVYDIVRFARQAGILCQGRGSAANSAVCYCLGITAVDPSRSQTLFERFISKERNEPPDIDVDFEHQRREEVIQYIYRRYGRDRAALAAVVITYRTRSALRDAGRALDVAPETIDAVTRACRHWIGRTGLADRMAQAGLDPASPTVRQWVALAGQLLGLPRHLSQHPGGFVISRGPLKRLVPIEPAAMAGRSVVQWDKDDLDAMGLLKVDILALGMLTALRRALDLANQHRTAPLRLYSIPDDPDTFDMISRADTIGTFQIESRAQMSMLPRLKPACYYDLVIQVAIVRPGPIQGGMVHPFLRRRQGLEPVIYPGQEVEQALRRTLGVPIFQEQVMQVAMLAAGFTAGEADQLRRAMAAWRRKGNLGGFHERLTRGMAARGYDPAFAEQIFRQIEGFGEYGFPESHAASFALLAYASSWLKRHEPEAFLAALLNSQPMGFYSPSILIQDARRHGVVVLPADVIHSHWEATLSYGKHARPAVRLGLNQVSGLAQDTAQRLVRARSTAPFADLPDCAERAALTRQDLQRLAAADALANLAGPRRQALWSAAASAPDSGLLQRATAQDDATPLFPSLSEGADLVADYRALGFSLRRHPLALLRSRLDAQRYLDSARLNTQPDRRLVRAAGIVTGRQRPGTAKGTIFVTLEDEHGHVNVIIRPALAERQRAILLQARLLGVHGVWQHVQNVRHVVAGHLVDLTPMLGALPTRSRDFH